MESNFPHGDELTPNEAGLEFYYQVFDEYPEKYSRFHFVQLL